MKAAPSDGPSDGVAVAGQAKGASPSKQQQQQQQQPSSEPTTTIILTKAERQRDKALQEVQQVMESLGTHQSLDHFNLLGVVANPLGSQHGGAAMTSPPPPPPSAMSAQGGGGPAGSNAASSFLFADTYNSLESTLSSVTGQIEALNHVFDGWSRHYLNDYYYYYQDGAADDAAIPASQLQELPPELTQLNVATVQVYLRKSGTLASTFQRYHQERVQKRDKQQQQQLAATASSSSSARNQPSASTTTATNDYHPTGMSLSNNDDNNNQIDLGGIPDVFFQADFDLTDPKTFRQLLLTPGDDDDCGGEADMRRSLSSSATTTSAAAAAAATTSTTATTTTAASSLHAALQEPTHDLFHIPPPDHFTDYLDTIEVALLEQVREKSEAFFQETNRFAQLKEWVGELLLDVQRIRGLLEGQSRAIQSWQLVPQWDRKRKQLVHMERILEGSNDILRCKQCIGGLLSAKDDLGAVEQIQYARRLLAGTVTEDDDDDEEEDNKGVDSSLPGPQQDGTDNTSGQAQQPQHASEKELPIELGRLQALRTVGDQLNQYESLVVTSLTEEVVEIFLEWNTSALASMYGLSSNGGAPSSLRASSQQEIQRRTINIIQSLKMCSALSHMSKFYSTRLHDMVRMTVRTTVGEFASDASSKAPGQSVSVSVTAMSLERFIDCLDMLFEQLLALLTSASGVDEFCQSKGLNLRDETGGAKTNGGSSSSNGNLNGKSGNEKGSEINGTSQEEESAIKAIVASAAELSSKSIAELLRLRKEVHSSLSLDEMRQVWDTCMKFIEEVEKLSGHKCVALRTMLLTQAKAYVERKHDSNMTALAAALDSERWTQCEVSSERQAALTRLCTGRAGVVSRGRLMRQSSLEEGHTSSTKSPEAEVEGIRYKVVWSSLLLVEMTMTNIEAAACFQSLASIVVAKVSDLLRLFNSRATQLVLGAGAIHSAARLKSINAKHLSLVTQCLGMTIAILPHIRAALMAQLPPKQHTLLTDLDKIKKDFADHNEKVLNKFVTIIGGIVEHGLAKHIGGTDFDARAEEDGSSPQNGVACCIFLEGVLTNTRKMHQVLSALLPPEHLQDVFSRIFAFIDQKIPALLIAAAENEGSASSGKAAAFSFPTTDDGKKRLLDEVAAMTNNLNALAGVFPWEFSAVSVLSKTLEYEIPAVGSRDDEPSEPAVAESGAGGEAPADTTEDSNGEDDEDYPEWVRSLRTSTGLETGIEIEFPGCENPSTLSLSTCMDPDDIAPMFNGTQWAGTRVWRSSIVAIQYILQNFGQPSNGSKDDSKTLLELGCGLGVPGMILHAMLGWKVVLTDKDPLPKQLETNCNTNFPGAYGKSIQAHELDWSRDGVKNLMGKQYFAAEGGESKDGFDFVLNCDCVYEPLYGLSWKLLVETIDELLRINPKTIVITCLERRKADGVENFLDALDRSEHISKVERIDFECDFLEVQLYRIYGGPES